MKKPNILNDSKKFLTGLFAGLIFGCLIGATILGGSNKSSLAGNKGAVFTKTSPQTETPIIAYTSSFTFTPTIFYTPTITETPSPSHTPTLTWTPLPPILNIPYTDCGDHMAYSANAESTKIPIVENDKIIDYANYVLVTYKIKNRYTNTPIYGFEVQPSPGYDNPDSYPHESPMFVSDPLIQPNQEVTLRSEHVFAPNGWNREQHPTAFWKFPENISPPWRYGDATEGNTITFQIVEKFGILENYKEVVRCNGVIRTP